MSSTALSKRIKNLNIEELVERLFPYSKDFKVSFKSFFKKGIADWPTWFIVIYRGPILNDHILLTICEHSEFTRTKYITEKFDLNTFVKEMNISDAGRILYTFFNHNAFIDEDHFLQLNEMKRLYDYLAENDIILFEPMQ